MPGKLIHGHSRRGKVTPEFRAWWAMIMRCELESGPRYDRYGGRGIRVCEKWRESFEAFLKDVGLRPTRSHSIDRIDNDGHYMPGNVRWATRKEQNANKTQRQSHLSLECNGECLSLSVWAKRTGISESVIRKRIFRGWEPSRTLSTPVLRRSA